MIGRVFEQKAVPFLLRFFLVLPEEQPCYNTQFHGFIRGDIRVRQQDFQSPAPTQAPGEKKAPPPIGTNPSL